MARSFIKDKPLVTSRLQKDFYYVTMGFFAWQLQQTREVKVRWKFTNRSKDIFLADHVDEGRLREELEHVASLKYTEAELQWLWDRYGNDKPNGFLTREYIDYLRVTPLSPYDLEKVGGNNGYNFEPYGNWSDGMDWETFYLPIKTELYGNSIARRLGVSWDEEWAEAERRHDEKLALVSPYPRFRVSSFGLRRQRSYELSFHLDRIKTERIPTQLAGISNVYNAMLLDWKEAGTYAHQGPMVYSALWGDTDAEVRGSHMKFVDDWAAVIGWMRTTLVLDTFGDKAAYEDMGPERAAKIPTFKIDSANPFAVMEELRDVLRDYGVDHRVKSPVPTDGLSYRRALALHLEGEDLGFANVFNGIGTNDSNDTGIKGSGSFVVKASMCNGRHLVKLSNNILKACGDPETVKRFARIHGYHATSKAQLIV